MDREQSRLMNIETNSRALRLKFLNRFYPPYWDEFPNSYRRKKGKLLFNVSNVDYRRWRTWKHTRKAQWKEKALHT